MHRATGSSIFRRLYASRTFFAAQGWYEGRAPCLTGGRPGSGTPTPWLASSQVPTRSLPGCQTPDRSGFPSAVRGTDWLWPDVFWQDVDTRMAAKAAKQEE